MANVEFKIDGMESLRNSLAEGIYRGLDNVRAEMEQFAEEVMADSKLEVPVDTGTLMSTGHVEPSIRTGDKVEVTMGYGGPAAGYAVYVHENLDPKVNWSRPGSGPKYLENPLKAKQDELPDRVLEAFKRGFEK